MNPRRRPALSLVAIIGATVAALGACGGPPPGDFLSACAASAKTSRTNAAGTMIAAFKAGQITAEDAINAAHDRLEAGEDATQFAGAVLDMLLTVEDRLPRGAEFEIFWMRVGQLAFRAALTAHNSGRPDEAYGLVLAGPKRWQTEPYWLRSPNHDALASIVLDENGERARAIARLRERPVLEGAAHDVYEKLTGTK